MIGIMSIFDNKTGILLIYPCLLNLVFLSFLGRDCSSSLCHSLKSTVEFQGELGLPRKYFLIFEFWRENWQVMETVYYLNMFYFEKRPIYQSNIIIKVEIRIQHKIDFEVN